MNDNNDHEKLNALKKSILEIEIRIDLGKTPEQKMFLAQQLKLKQEELLKVEEKMKNEGLNF